MLKWDHLPSGVLWWRHGMDPCSALLALCRENISDAELWWFLCFQPEQTVGKKTVDLPLIWDAMTLMKRHNIAVSKQATHWNQLPWQNKIQSHESDPVKTKQIFSQNTSNGPRLGDCPSRHWRVTSPKTIPRWRQQMETFSVLLAFCAGNSPVTGEFPSQRPVSRSFDASFYLRLHKRLSKQSRCRWFETPWRSLWRHCNTITEIRITGIPE